jgi:hypothetical protein
MHELSNITAAYNETLTDPDYLVKLVLLSIEKYKGKKKIIHFLKPHHPYSNGMTCMRMAYKHLLGTCSVEDVVALYKEGLRKVLRAAKVLISQLEGVTVISADHAELLGEDGLWGHSARTLDLNSRDELKMIESEEKINHIKLREVPWFKVAQPEPQKQLEALGYM